MKQLKGFTLAEILLTLTIVGIVASITIPALITRVDNAVYVSQLRKTYSVLSQALIMIRNDNAGSLVPVASKDTLWGGNFMLNTFLTKMNYAKVCTSGGCWYNSNVYYLNGTVGIPNMDTSTSPSNYGKAILSDGTMLLLELYSTSCSESFGPVKNVCALLYVDVNGAKPPNKIGRDFYLFYITSTNIIPLGSNDGNTCGSGTYGMGCANYVLSKGVMDY